MQNCFINTSPLFLSLSLSDDSCSFTFILIITNQPQFTLLSITFKIVFYPFGGVL